MRTVSPPPKNGLTTGDQLFRISDQAYQVQIDASGTGLTGTLQVVYSTPGSDAIKYLYDSTGAAVTIDLSAPKVVIFSGMIVDQVGVTPTVAVSGGSYSLSVSWREDGESSRG